MNKIINWIKLHITDKWTYIILVSIVFLLLELFHRNIMNMFWDYLFLNLLKTVITKIVMSDYFTGQIASILIIAISGYFKFKKGKKK
jgi:hypothetical protein